VWPGQKWHRAIEISLVLQLLLHGRRLDLWNTRKTRPELGERWFISFFFAIILVLCCRLVADGGNISKASSQIRLYDYVTIEAAYSIQELEVNEAWARTIL
jgi:hypothetical protein